MSEASGSPKKPEETGSNHWADWFSFQQVQGWPVAVKVQAILEQFTRAVVGSWVVSFSGVEFSWGGYRQGKMLTKISVLPSPTAV